MQYVLIPRNMKIWEKMLRNLESPRHYYHLNQALLVHLPYMFS